MREKLRPLQAGRLNHRITIQTPVQTMDALNSPVSTWTDVITVWASIYPVLGYVTIRNEKLREDVTHMVRIRYRTVLPSYRIKYGTRYFDIKYILDIEEANIYMDLLCRETV